MPGPYTLELRERFSGSGFRGRGPPHTAIQEEMVFRVQGLRCPLPSEKGTTEIILKTCTKKNGSGPNVP
jgi:hypothetical protein